MPRAVVDTNVWVSAVLNPKGQPARILDALTGGRVDLVMSQPLFDELADVLSRPRLVRKYGIAREDINTLISLLEERSERVVISGTVKLCRDPDDDMVIETALRGRADALITRDEDLSRAPDLADVLRTHDIDVMTVRRFLSWLESSGESS